ncbi:TetR/AcrR family transcriptional regulator [Sphingomonas sp. BK235]|uniref:TetR/AcrR family transcriptional regulator n=1 Tax=Sphingomonas sp. BK235 TaxID=2512131 RepID=UPI001A9EDBFC|nr:TetR/AcrR family transcriptional regulator [Sphingomonas sp. BK235]
MIAAAVELIAERGSRAITLAAVGTAAGYSRGIVTHHFGSRDKLLRAIMEHTRTFDIPGRRENAMSWLGDMVRAYLEKITEQRPAARAFLQMWGEAIGADPVLMPLYAEQDAGFRRLIAQKITEGIQDGSIRADADPDAMGVFVVGLLRGIALQLIATPPPQRMDAIGDEAERAVRLALRA